MDRYRKRGAEEGLCERRCGVSTGRAKAAFTAKGNEFQISAVRTSIHGTTVRRVTTRNYLADIFDDSRTRVKFVTDGKRYSTVKTVRGVLRPAFQLAVDDDVLHKIHLVLNLPGGW